MNDDQSLRFGVLRLRKPPDQSVTVLDFHRHRGDLFENRAECLSQTWRQHCHAPLGEAQGGRSRFLVAIFIFDGKQSQGVRHRLTLVRAKLPRLRGSFDKLSGVSRRAFR
jgi:hypothetical protein